MAWREGPGLSLLRFPYYDERGSVIAIADATSTLAVNRYDEYGQPAATNVGLHQYAGQLWLAGMRVYHAQARAYNPRLGRFNQPDPIGFGGGMNLYAYTGNDPVNRVDPWGLDDDDIIVEGVCDYACRWWRLLNSARQAFEQQQILMAEQWASGQYGAITCYDICLFLPDVTQDYAESVQYSIDRGTIQGAKLTTEFYVGRAAVKGIIWGVRGALAVRAGATTRGIVTLPKNSSQIGHIFRNAPGHLPTHPPIGSFLVTLQITLLTG